MLEARFEDPISGPSLIAFDGRVVELFTLRSAEANRLHISILAVEVRGPDKRGSFEVWFTGGANRRGGGFRLTVPSDAWPQVQPIVDAAYAAIQR